MSNPSLERRTEFGVDCKFARLSVSISLGATLTSITSGRALHHCRKNAIKSICLVLRIEALRLIKPSAAKESQDKICCFVSFISSALDPNFNDQFHCCRKLMPSQSPESEANNLSSPLLSAIVDCFLLDAVIGYQPSLPRNHDAEPLTLNRSAPPAQSESTHDVTEPTGALLIFLTAFPIALLVSS